MAQRTAGFETGTLTATLATTDTGNADAFDEVATNGTIIYDATHVSGGSKACKIVVAGARTHISWLTTLGDAGHFGRVYVYETANPTSASQDLVHVLDSGATDLGFVRINTDGTISVADAGGVTRATSAATLTLNQWTRVEWKFVHSATVGVAEAKLFNTASSGTATETVTATAINTGVSAGYIRVGWCTSNGDGTVWIDDVVAGAASYPGPVGGVSGGSNAPEKLRVVQSSQRW